MVHFVYTSISKSTIVGHQDKKIKLGWSLEVAADAEAMEEGYVN